jgi:hypothetical protein
MLYNFFTNQKRLLLRDMAIGWWLIFEMSHTAEAFVPRLGLDALGAFHPLLIKSHATRSDKTSINHGGMNQLTITSATVWCRHTMSVNLFVL